MTLNHRVSRTNFSKGRAALTFKDSRSMTHSHSITSQNPQNPSSNDYENPKTHNRTFTHEYVWVRLNFMFEYAHISSTVST